MIGVLHLSHYGNTTTTTKKKQTRKSQCAQDEKATKTLLIIISDKSCFLCHLLSQWQCPQPPSHCTDWPATAAFESKILQIFFFTFPRECPKQHQNKGTRCWCLYNTHSSEMLYQDQNICRWVRDSTMVCIKGRPENYISGYRICDGERRYHPETTDSSVPHCSCSGGPGAAQRLFSLSAARLRSARDGQTG